MIETTLPGDPRLDDVKAFHGNAYANHGAALIEGLEAFFGVQIRDLAVRYRSEVEGSALPVLQSQLDLFLDEYLDQVRDSVVRPIRSTHQFELYLDGRLGEDPRRKVRRLAKHEAGRRLRTPPTPDLDPERFPVVDVGEVRPTVRLRRGDSDPWGRSQPAADAKTTALYADSTLLLDTFCASAPSAWRPMTDALTPDHEGLSRTEWLARSLELYADLTPAFRAGILDLQPVCLEHPNPTSEIPREYLLGEVHTRMWEAETGRRRNNQSINAVSRDLLLQLAVAFAAPGLVHTVARPGLEEILLSSYYQTLYPRRQALELSLEQRTTARLLLLNLPGVKDTRMTDLVSIRQETVFAEIRGAIGEAVRRAVAEPNVSDAQRAAQEVFFERRPSKTRISKELGKAVLRDGVKYGIGAALAAKTGNWQPLLPLAAGSAWSAVQTAHEIRARKAQRNLYVALARSPESHSRN